jgi:hypothetical protein
MGRPLHYSTDIPERCKDLLDLLLGHIEDDANLLNKWGGPLRTTFLLSLATPMVVLPIERIFKPVVQGRAGVANDAYVDAKLDDRIADVLGAGRCFERAPFFEGKAWRFVPEYPAFNVGAHWPAEVLDMLATAKAEECARTADAADILLLLRNALAHGGITYLDRNGRETEAATNMLGFAGWARSREALRILRVSVGAFERFLREWADWIAQTGVAEELNHRGPGYFEKAAA